MSKINIKFEGRELTVYYHHTDAADLKKIEVTEIVFEDTLENAPRGALWKQVHKYLENKAPRSKTGLLPTSI